MSEINCRWVASDKPRVVPHRHAEPCELEDAGLADYCKGCLPCPEGHCRVCGREHADGTCPGCLADTRETLWEIVERCWSLPDEAEAKGVEGEAMMLLGPTAQPEAWRQRGRYGHTFDFEARLGENHPLWVLGTWEMLYRDALDHVSHAKVAIGAAAAYLDRNLAYLGGYEDVPFEDLARDLRSCLAHLDAVLHDGEQVDRGAPCMKCGKPLERTWGSDEKADGWQCPRCKRTSTDAQYRFAVAHLHREEAEWLTDQEMEVRTGVKAGTIRVWARREKVARRRHSGRTEYLVADVEAQLAS